MSLCAHNYLETGVSVELPVFGKLLICIDLAVVAALIKRYVLFTKSGFESTVIADAEHVHLPDNPVRQFTSSQVCYAQGRQGWIVTLLGGIDIDGWSIAANTEVDPKMTAAHQQVIESSAEAWWWD